MYIENKEQLQDLNLYCKNQEQYNDVLFNCKVLDKKGYKFYINRNFSDTGIYVTIANNNQIEGQLIFFDDGNWSKDVYLKNISLYEHGHIEVSQDLLKTCNLYRITGLLPLNI